jgi:uncharacterized RDD family membrane protein YckC
MTWYYAQGDRQQGPASEEEFQGLVASGVVRPETLVWHSGMAEWRPYSEVMAIPAATPVGAVLNCAECGKPFPPDEVIRYGDRCVCAVCKPLFLQRLREGVVAPGELLYATFWHRFGAKFVDIGILWIVNMVLGLLSRLLLVSGGSSTPAGLLAFQAVLGAFSVIINLGYVIFFLGKFGATPGKMALKLRVVTPEGGPIGYGRAAGRAFAEILSAMICYIGYLICISDPERRTLHDRICNTRVIKL